MGEDQLGAVIEAGSPDLIEVNEFGVIDAVIPDAWPGWLVALVDVLALASATVLAGFVLADATSRVRAIDAVVFFVAVPGWATLRAVRARPCALTFMSAIALSLTFLFIGGEILVTRLNFPWRGATVMACGLSALVLVVDVGAKRWQR